MPFSYNNHTNAQLIEAISKGEQGALAQLYDLYALALYRCIIRQMPGQAEAERVLEEVFMAAWMQIENLGSGQDLLPWLLTLAKKETNIALLHREARRRKVDRALQELFCRQPRHSEVPL